MWGGAGVVQTAQAYGPPQPGYGGAPPSSCGYHTPAYGTYTQQAAPQQWSQSSTVPQSNQQAPPQQALSQPPQQPQQPPQAWGLAAVPAAAAGVDASGMQYGGYGTQYRGYGLQGHGFQGYYGAGQPQGQMVPNQSTAQQQWGEVPQGSQYPPAYPQGGVWPSAAAPHNNASANWPGQAQQGPGAGPWQMAAGQVQGGGATGSWVAGMKPGSSEIRLNPNASEFVPGTGGGKGGQQQQAWPPGQQGPVQWQAAPSAMWGQGSPWQQAGGQWTVLPQGPPPGPQVPQQPPLQQRPPAPPQQQQPPQQGWPQQPPQQQPQQEPPQTNGQQVGAAPVTPGRLETSAKDQVVSEPSPESGTAGSQHWHGTGAGVGWVDGLVGDGADEKACSPGESPQPPPERPQDAVFETGVPLSVVPDDGDWSVPKGPDELKIEVPEVPVAHEVPSPPATASSSHVEVNGTASPSAPSAQGVGEAVPKPDEHRSGRVPQKQLPEEPVVQRLVAEDFAPQKRQYGEMPVALGELVYAFEGLVQNGWVYAYKKDEREEVSDEGWLPMAILVEPDLDISEEPGEAAAPAEEAPPSESKDWKGSRRRPAGAPKDGKGAPAAAEPAVRERRPARARGDGSSGRGSGRGGRKGSMGT